MRGRTSDQLRDEIKDGFTLQCWDFRGACGYWVVADAVFTSSSFSLVEDLMRSEQERMATRPVANVASGDMALNTNWMRRTGWTDVFAGEDRGLLAAMAVLPSGAEDNL
jgi:hypothetical protein